VLFSSIPPIFYGGILNNISTIALIGFISAGAILGVITLVLFSKDKKITIQNKKGVEPFALLGIIFLCAGIALSSTIKRARFQHLSLTWFYLFYTWDIRPK